MPTASSDLDSALGTFGLESYRPGQREVIEAIVAGHDCMCIMPTGGGKSLCYQLPSTIRPGLTIVVSPLIALMKDQVDSLATRGISAALINSSLSASEQNKRLEDVAAGKYQMVYVAPERLRNSRFQEAIRATPIQLLAIDEAHCISQWGHDFRPDYTRIGHFRELLGGVQTVALTATATPRVREDIVQVLRLRKPKQFMSGFARPNLHFGVVQLSADREKEQQLLDFLNRTNGSGIIYSATRKRCEALVELITANTRRSIGSYHAGLLPDQRKAIQERFMRGDLEIVVATNAFGMGIDKSDLRFVVHYNMPGSLEAYYQEAGRAGRDGRHSQCVMLFSLQDRHIQEFFIDNKYPERSLIEQVYDFLLKREEDPIELTLEEIRDSLGVNVSPEAIGSCLQVLGRTNVLKRLDTGGGLALVRLDSRLPTLVDLLPREAKVRRTVMRLLERSVGDRRGEHVPIHPRWLLQESQLNKDSLARALRELSKLDEVDYVPPFRGRAVHFLRRDVPFDQLKIDFANLRKRKEAEYDRLNHVVNYAQSPLCRQSRILNYFGDTSADACGQCDRCQRSPGWPKFDQSQLPSEASDQPSGTAANAAANVAAPGPADSNLSPQLRQLMDQVIDSIQRVHGRLGKHLLSQYLCGSKNAKVQKLNLHRLSGFGLLRGCRQGDAVLVLEALIAAGLLRQQEVNRNRPTVSVAPEWMDQSARPSLLEHVNLPPDLARKLGRHAPAPSNPPAASSDANRVPRHRESLEPIDTARRFELAGGEQAVGRGPALRERDPIEAVSVNASNTAARPKNVGLNDAGAKDARRDDARPEDAGAADDWRWTLRLFQAEFHWQEVRAMRRMTDEELVESLKNAIQNGEVIPRSWLSAQDDGLRTPGQQRLLRELQRRSAAGIS